MKNAGLNFGEIEVFPMPEGVRAASVKKCGESLQWDDWERYSNRQQTSMRLGGFVGEIEYRGEAIKDYLPLIAAGELLHVGAGTSFGLGKYEIVR